MFVNKSHLIGLLVAGTLMYSTTAQAGRVHGTVSGAGATPEIIFTSKSNRQIRTRARNGRYSVVLPSGRHGISIPGRSCSPNSVRALRVSIQLNIRC